MRGFLANMAFSKLISQVLFPIPTYRDARTHLKTIFDDLRGVGRCLGPKNVQNFKVVFWAFSGQK